MWKNKSEIPSKNGEYPSMIHPTFKRENEDLGYFRVTLIYEEGNWYTNRFYFLDVMRWELIAWYDVPDYNES